MTFNDDDGKRISLSVDYPKEEILEAEIIYVIDLIVSKNIFTSNGLNLISTLDGKVVFTDTTPYDLVIG